MNLELDELQRDMVRATAEICERAGGARAATEVTERPDRAGIARLGAVGVLGVRHPEPQGAGLGPVESVLLAEECGAVLAPAPLLIWADLVGPAVAGVTDGSTLVTGSFQPGGGVSHGREADVLIDIASEGARAVDARTVRWEDLPSVDPLITRARPVGSTEGTMVADGNTVGAWHWQARLLAAAHQVGVGRGALAVAVAFAGEREQFGNAIGSFQAVKHLLADVYVAVELARSQVLTASLCWAEGQPVAAAQASAAMVVASRAALTACRTAIQVHGGVGFTWDSLPHHFYKRALLLQEEFGSARVLAAELAEPGALIRA